jgi:adenosylmethionine-8-amino-7-oxononanoate aminotransferase
MVTERTEEFLRDDAKYIIHPSFVIGGQLRGIVWEKAYGIMLVDTEGKEYIDLSSQLICCNLGHGRREIIDAITEAVNKTDYTSNYFGFSSVATIECARRLAKLTPENLNHFFFVSGGSEANESAVKYARFYQHARGKSTKHKIISLYNSYHGTSGMSTSITGVGRGYFSTGFGPAPSGFLHIPTYYCYRCPFGLEYPDCSIKCAQFLEEVIESEDPATVAAFIAEPIQGTGGIIDPPPEYWPMVRKICTDHDVLLIADEVMSGFARTGKMFAIEHWHIRPDIMTMAKGITGAYLPFGAVAISDELYEVLKGKLVAQGYTYSGHPIACAASVAALDIYVKDKVVDNSARVGKHIRKRLDTEFLPLPGVGRIGGKGMFLGVELVKDKKGKIPIDADMREDLNRKLLGHGIYPRLGGSHTVGQTLYVCPPCVMTVEEADRTLDVLKSLIAKL